LIRLSIAGGTGNQGRAIGPENRPDVNELGNVGDCVDFPSGAMEEGGRRAGSIVRTGELGHAGKGGAGGESWL
jgi:hypothetical protein